MPFCYTLIPTGGQGKDQTTLVHTAHWLCSGETPSLVASKLLKWAASISALCSKWRLLFYSEANKLPFASEGNPITIFPQWLYNHLCIDQTKRKSVQDMQKHETHGALPPSVERSNPSHQTSHTLHVTELYSPLSIQSTVVSKIHLVQCQETWRPQKVESS